MNSGGRWVVLSYHSRKTPGEARISRGRASRNASRADETRDPAQRARNDGQPRSRSAKLRCAEECGCIAIGKVRYERKKKSRAMTEFHTVSDRQFALCATLSPQNAQTVPHGRAGRRDCAFFMMYIYQHFQCIDLSFRSRASKPAKPRPLRDSSLNWRSPDCAIRCALT